jgi:mono/diheme cytochrome c family protein
MALSLLIRTTHAFRAGVAPWAKMNEGGSDMMKVLVRVVAIAFLLVPILLGQKAKTGADSGALVIRGKYLVEGTSMCGDCHTPRNEKGEPIREQWLKGAAIDFKPTVPMPVWADKAVPIAGLPGWDREAAIKFLMTGVVPNSVPARPPMPQYRFNRQDATAIVAYLKSLGPAE